jgi:putative phage-type endonuclease
MSRFTPIEIEQRRSTIGGSEAAAALGVDPFRSMLALWAEKTGRIPPADLSEDEAVQWGIDLEPLVLQKLADRTGRHIEPRRDRFVSGDYPFMSSHPDAFQWCRADERFQGFGVAEAKTNNRWMRQMWLKKHPPLHVNVQLQHNMFVTGAEWGTVCALTPGTDTILEFHLRDVKLDHEFIEWMIRGEEHFWNLVQTETPPPPDGSGGCRDVIKEMYPRDDGEVIDLPAEAAEWDVELEELKKIVTANNEKMKATIKRKQILEDKFKVAMGNALWGVLPSGDEYKCSTVNVKPRDGYSYRKLTRSKRK